jgi:membrane-associated phospholipid phosphatase
MELTQDLTYSTPRPAASLARVARWISNLFSPPLMIIVGVCMVAASLGVITAWQWALQYLFIAMVIPVSFIIWQYIRGRITSVEMHLRSERIQPYLVSLFCSLAAWLWLRLGMAPALLTLVAGVGAVQVALLLAVTLFWKISAHSTSMAGVVMLALALFGAMALPLIVLVPLVGWARIHLRRHSLMQVVAGVLVGAGLMALPLWLI